MLSEKVRCRCEVLNYRKEVGDLEKKKGSPVSQIYPSSHLWLKFPLADKGTSWCYIYNKIVKLISSWYSLIL